MLLNCGVGDGSWESLGVQELYFPQGELLKIVGVAENDEIIQFHFTRGNETEALEDVMMQMDSTIRQFNQISGPH